MREFGSWNAREIANGTEEITALEAAEVAQNWPLVAELVNAYDGVRCPSQCIPELNIHLAARGLSAVHEPGVKSLLVVTLEDLEADEGACANV